MDLKKLGVKVDCENCAYACSNGCGGFDVTVPVSDNESGVIGTAKLHCTISPMCHQIEFVEWHDVCFSTISPAWKVQPRISAALDFVAEHRVCGNRRICPAEVIRIVEEYGGR